MNLFDLRGKVAIVTGASRGIGESIAVELARNGADVVVSDIISGEDVVKKIKKLKRRVIYVKTDISNRRDVENLIIETMKKFRKIDILVNNAGIFKSAPTIKFSEDDWNKTIDINLKGVFLCSREALKYMRRGGSIINISSVAGICGYAQSAAYCASKGGIRLLTKSLAAEFGPQGIRVNSIHPGVIETAMTQGILQDEKTKQNMLSKIPLKRTGTPIDIAGPAVFLASDASSYMTGAEIVADGGWVSCL
jgi:NAD(P)-dependent dehydrogenase (short-subunit alcohol dehydrogenase family)